MTVRSQPQVEHVCAHVLRGTAFAGYRVAFLSDFHHAPWQNSRSIANAVDIVNAWAPDLVALGGDFGFSTRLIPPVSAAIYRTILPRVVRELSRLSSHDGVFAVLGNHDWDAGADRVDSALGAIGVRVLHDAVHVISRREHAFCVAGVDHPWSAILPRGAVDREYIVDVTLLLSHHPDVLTELQELDAALVILAGHTHGGQVTLPRLGAPITLSRVATRRFPAGFIPNERSVLYVSRGLGEQVPLRVGAPREVTLLELRER